MKSENRSILVPFYFGAIEDSARLTVERELLTDSELLVDYLDLKRELEAAFAVPEGPSAALWERLRPRTRAARRRLAVAAIGVALAAGVALCFEVAHPARSARPRAASPAPAATGVLDSSGELSADSGVL